MTVECLRVRLELVRDRHAVGSEACAHWIVHAIGNRETAESAGAGLFGGVVLAVIGLRLTKFEATPEGRFYTPNGWIGLGVTALFLGRLAARFFTMSEGMIAAQAGAPPFAGLQRSPLTLALFLLLAGYYVAYFAGVVRKAKRMTAGYPTNRESRP